MNRRQATALLVGCGYLIYFFATLQKVVVPGAIFNELQQDFGGGAARITALGAAFTYTYALIQLLIGLLADKFGGSRVIVGGGLLLCAGSLGSAFAGSYTELFIWRIATGFGSGAIYLSLVKETARLFPASRFTFMLSLMFLVGASGGVVGNTPFIAGSAIFGWHKMLAAAALPLIAVYIGYVALHCRLPMPPPVPGRLGLKPFLEAAKRRHNRDMWLFFLTIFGIYFMLQSMVGKKFLEDYLGMSNSGAGAVMTGMMICAAVSGFLCGPLSRLLGDRRKIFLCGGALVSITTLSVLLLALILDLRWPLLGIGFFLIAFSANISPVAASLLRETNRPDQLGVVMSVYNAGAYLGAALLGNIGGRLMDCFTPSVAADGSLIYGRGSYLLLFSALLAAGLIGAACSLRLRETRGRNHALSTR